MLIRLKELRFAMKDLYAFFLEAGVEPSCVSYEPQSEALFEPL